MAAPQMKMPEKNVTEPEEKLSQRKRPEMGRFIPTAGIAFAAGLAIKNDFPSLHVTVYDSVEHARTTIAASPTP